MTPREVLTEMRAKLEEGWTQGATARNAAGVPCEPMAEDAVCWCIYGAAIAIGATWEERRVVYALLQPIAAGDVSVFNDQTSTDKARILELIDMGLASLPEAA